MKMFPPPSAMKRFPGAGFLAAILVMFLFFSGIGGLQAATLVAINGGSNPTSVNAIPTTGTPGFGTAGYRFYAFGTPPGGVSSGYGHLLLSNLPNYVASVSESNPGSRYLSVANTTLTVSGTNYVTGYLIDNTVTVTLGSNVPSVFRIGFLLDNAGSSSDRSYRPVLISPNGAFASVTVTDWQYHSKGNNLLVFEIQNASQGDQIAITVNRLGGVVFDTVTASVPGAQPDLSGFPLTFSEEFDGPLDVSKYGSGSKWSATLPYGGSFGGVEFTYDSQRNPFSVQNGILSIRMWKDLVGYTMDGAPIYQWYSGLLASVTPQGQGFSQQYGYFEARMKMPGIAGAWGAFWMMTKGKQETPKRDSAEIDVVEFYGDKPDESAMAMHYWKAAGGDYYGRQVFSPQSGLTADFHTYGALVTPETITWYIDGVEQWQQPTGVEAHEPFYVMVNYAIADGRTPGDALIDSEVLVDYIRVYALPENPTPPAPESLNRALYRPAVASSEQSGTYTARRATDGNPASRWSSAHSDNQWISVDLGSRFAINRVKLSWESAYATSYSVQMSDDATNWTTIYSTTTGNGGVDDLAGLTGAGQYVRIYCAQRATQWGSSLWEIEVYGDPSPMINFAEGRPVTTSSTENQNVTGDKAVDGNFGSRWASAHADNQWIVIDLGQTYPIDRIQLYWELAYATSYQVQTSTNGTTWMTIYSTTSGNGGLDDLQGLSASGRYVRVNCLVRKTEWGFSLWEIRVHPPSGYQGNLALSKPVTVSSQYSSGYAGSMAVDGNATTRWSSVYANNEWLMIDLGQSYPINRVKLSWEAAYATAYQVQVSNDATNWATLYSTTSGNGGIDDLTGLSGNGRYVRIFCTQRATHWGNSLWEVEVY
jgi:beta-glucanase (GH16 family)